MRHAAPRALRIVGVLLAFGGTAVLDGCAWIGREAKLVYPPPQPAEAAAPAPPTPAPDAPAVAVTVSDARPEPRTKVGSVRNALGMAMASVTTAGDVPAWVKGALEAELRAAGLRVIPAEEGATALDAEVAKVDCDAYLEYGASVVVSARLTSRGAAVYSSSYTGQGSAGTNWTATEESYTLSLSLALRDAARQMAADVKKALVGGAPAPPSS